MKADTPRDTLLAEVDVVPVLLVRDRGGSPKLHKLAGLMVYVGRDAGCAVVLPNTAVSRRHVKLTRKDGGWFLEDLDSPNGTLLNDQPVKKSALAHQDVIRIGRFRIEYLLEDQLDAEARRKLGLLYEHGRAPLGEDQATYVLSPAMREKLMRAERARDLLVLVHDTPGGRTWRPEGRTLRIGPSGDVPAKQFLRSSPVAQIEWDGQRYQLRRLGFWGRVELNGAKVTEAAVKAGDKLRVGTDDFLLREEDF
jgi:pSer/pThr/pTyr-binding forkhead associated (FHA) protein